MSSKNLQPVFIVLAILGTILPTIDGLGVLQSPLFQGSCLHVKDSSMSAGGGYELATCRFNDGSQQLNVFQIAGSNTTAVPIQFDFIRELCMTAVDSGGDGAVVTQQTCAGANDQNWQLVNGSPDGIFQLMNPATALCLTLTGGGTTTNYTIQSVCNTTMQSQYWSIVYIPQIQGQDGGLYNPGSRWCLSIKNLTTDNATDVDVKQCNFLGTSSGLLWNLHELTLAFEQPGHSATWLTNYYSGNCLTVADNSSAVGARLQMFPCLDYSNPQNSSYQAWNIFGNIFFTFGFQNAATGLLSFRVYTPIRS